MTIDQVINIEKIREVLVLQIPNVLAATLIFVAFLLLYRLTRRPLELLCKGVDVSSPLTKLLVRSVYKWSLVLFGALMAAQQLGVEVGAAFAGIGVVGIAIGFAAQDSLSNVIAGFIIFIDKPFTVGDWIEVDGHYGKVWEITLRTTRIQTLNHTYIVIPNKTIIDSTLNNHSKYGRTRLEVPVGIAYKESTEAARIAILEAVPQIEHVLTDPAPSVVVTELGDSSVNLLVRVWIKNAEHEKAVFYATTETCKLALDAAEIEIPFPHLQLFIDDVKEEAAKRLRKA